MASGSRIVSSPMASAPRRKGASRSRQPLPSGLRPRKACSKALGTGIRHGVFWRDMEVINLAGGRPTMRLSGGAAERLASMTPEGMEAFIHLTLTDEPPMAMAVVMIEARPRATL